MRKACQAAAATLELVRTSIVPGMTTADIDQIVHNDTLMRGGYPAPLNYKGFPRSVCVSVNEVACHGIPSQQRLNEGDAVNVDVTTIIDGHFGDTNATFIVGDVANARPDVVKLVDVTHQALVAGIAVIKAGVPVTAIGAAVEDVVTRHGLSVVREFGGHGINTVFHDVPHVRHFIDPLDKGDVLEAGMFITVEPIVSLGSPDIIIDPDGWTVRTRDGAWTAQFEETIMVTTAGYEVLTHKGAT